MAPKISIVTCSHNRPELLRRAIESVRAQTDPDWEHLIYDDCSTDLRVRRVLEWAAQDPRVRVWLGRENVDQPSRLWNYMLDRAHGRYFTVLDDDNEKLPSFVAAMSHELESDPSLDVVTCGWRVDHSDGSPSVPCFLNQATSAEQLARISTCDGGAMLYRRSAFERVGYFSEALRTSEDWDWLRRAVHSVKVKNLHEIHATYRSHGGSRMHRAVALGSRADFARVRGQHLSAAYGVTAAYPGRERLTASQSDACSSIERALASLPWITTGHYLRLVISPFQMSNDDAAAAVRGYSRVVSLHMEDPYALAANLERVRAMRSAVAETWVCTNDAATVPHYRQIVGDRIIVCPTLGPDTLLPPVDGRERDIDVLFCGYAYPSRRRFMSELLPLLDGLRVQLVGDGWQDFGVPSMTTQSLAQTYELHRRARAVVCSHRLDGDCGAGPVSPQTVNRGAMEGYSGARVFIDRSRPLHDFDENDVVWYDSPTDLALKLRAHLDASDNSAAHAFSKKCANTYSYRSRLARVINSVRASRMMVEIP